MLTLIGQLPVGASAPDESQLSELDSNIRRLADRFGVALSTLVILGASITGLAVARDAHRHGLRSVVVDSADGPGLHSRRASPVR